MVRKHSESSVSIGIRKTMISLQNGNSLVEKQKPGEYTIKIANTLEERESVFRLGYQIYLEKGFIGANSQEWLVRNYDANEETVILIAQDKEKNIIGSVTLVFDAKCKLPAEKMYADEINTVRACGHSIAEISRLIIHPEYRNSKEVLLLLFNYLAIYTYHVKRYNCLTVQVNPRHTSYYKQFLNFEEIGALKFSPHLNNAPAILLSLPTSVYQSEIRNTQTSNEPIKKERSLYPHFLKQEQEMLVAHYLKNHTKPISIEEKMYFGLSESGINKADIV